MSYWKRNIAPTYKQFSNKYILSDKKDHPEWMYIDYIRSGKTNWKKDRGKLASKIIKLIDERIY